MGTQSSEDLDINIGNTVFFEVEIPSIKSEFALENVECVNRTNDENDLCLETSLECAQIDLVTESEKPEEVGCDNVYVKSEMETEMQNSSEPMVGAFYEVNYKSDEMEYVSTEGESDCSFVNGEPHNNLIFTNAQSMGDGCVLQILDPKMFEGLNGKHTIRCSDGTEIQVDIVHQENQNDTLRDNKNFKIVLPNSSPVVKTYPPSNKASAPPILPVHSNTTSVTDQEIHSFFQNTNDEPEVDVKVDVEMKIKPEPDLPNPNQSSKCKSSQKTCLKCKKVFSKPHQLVWHCETMCGTKPFRCYTCNKRFSKEKFNYHVLLCRERAKNAIVLSGYNYASDSDS